MAMTAMHSYHSQRHRLNFGIPIDRICYRSRSHRCNGRPSGTGSLQQLPYFTVVTIIGSGKCDSHTSTAKQPYQKQRQSRGRRRSFHAAVETPRIRKPHEGLESPLSLERVTLNGWNQQVPAHHAVATENDLNAFDIFFRFPFDHVQRRRRRRRNYCRSLHR